MKNKNNTRKNYGIASLFALSKQSTTEPPQDKNLGVAVFENRQFVDSKNDVYLVRDYNCGIFQVINIRGTEHKSFINRISAITFFEELATSNDDSHSSRAPPS